MGAVIEHEVVVRDRYDEAIDRLPLTPHQERAVRTVRGMLIAADEMIARDGFDRFTTADVAQAAGVSIGIVYRYFTDRVAILDALYPDRYALLRPGALEEHDAAVARKAVQAAADWLLDTVEGMSSPLADHNRSAAVAIHRHAALIAEAVR
jgi:AcrR family transcriptional regulator